MSVLTRLRWGGAVLLIASSGLMADIALASPAFDLSAKGAAADIAGASGRQGLGPFTNIGGPFTNIVAASAATPARGVTYAGGTSTDDPIVIVLARDGKSIKRMTTQLIVPCTSGMSYAYNTNTSSKVTISTSGKFAGAQAFNEPDLGEGRSGSGTAIARGKVDGKRLSGSTTVQLDVVDATGAKVDTCEEHATFKARSARREVFGGLTSQGLAVMIRVTAKPKLIVRDDNIFYGHEVRIFHIGWEAPCTPSGFLQWADTLDSFRIRSGRFGDHWTNERSYPTGERETSDYSLRGKIQRASVSGTFSVKSTKVQATGASFTCDTGPVTYSAKSG